MKFVRTRMSSITLTNFMSFENYKVSFLDAEGMIRPMTGLFGPNGTGKSTMLNATAMLLKNYNGYTEQRLVTAFQKYLRNVKNPDVPGEFVSNETGYSSTESGLWKISGEFVTEEGVEYTVTVGNSKEHFKWQSGVDGEQCVVGLVQDHPDEIRETLVHQCYTTTYDKELNQFQLRKDRWTIFKKLFETVTGYVVDKVDGKIDEKIIAKGDAKRLAEIQSFVLSLIVQKPGETISERQCSDGEKKTIKNFTTLLNKDVIPSVILIDNVEMHVEIDRHLSLVLCISECFPDSQIVFTTHSPAIINYYDISSLVSLANKNIPQGQGWRQELGRMIRGMILTFRGEELIGECKAFSKKLDDEKFDDRREACGMVAELLKKGSGQMFERLETASKE